jgi:hypothetical protein
MSAVGAHGVDLITDFGEEDLGSFNAFDLDLLLLSILEADAGQVLELVFGGHGA